MNSVSVVLCLLVGFAASILLVGGYLKRPRK